ncbi:hypothetical protein HGO38_30550 [Rhizobium sp. CG5]|uniref:hypothetical protein n=1 Tax=Rhizobium sp. CG5 TaxID=2726076 RepID=UPI0020343F67|nr:hypothetical protein [Rhizobium sp. CG5]MCM2477789.1 hypothetical protein [Rhizobium sp. CG5]
MSDIVKSQAIWRALTTVNAPLPFHINDETLLSCLNLSTTDLRWRPHVRAFFREVGVEVIMDMVVEGATTFDNLSKAISVWSVEEDYENARWIREMVAVPVARSDALDAAGAGFGHRGRHRRA